MQELLFLVQDGQNRNLEVKIHKSGKNLTASCTCTPNHDDICQHVINIFTGSAKGIVSNNSDDVKKISSWISGTDVGKAMHDLMESIKHLENAKEDFSSARKRLIKALKD